MRVQSGHFDGRYDGVITAAHFDNGWLYRVDVSAGDGLNVQRSEDGELLLCDFELRPVAIGV
ncbi:MAG: hypothetical protein O7H39_07750 [Gammaproteobacteria bacterium]|nr:hypothetical protein [Gammaproteobacteria bacterium]